MLTFDTQVEVPVNEAMLLANQEAILAGQATIQRMQEQLDKILAIQATILTNQEKLDKILGSQQEILEDMAAIDDF